MSALRFQNSPSRFFVILAVLVSCGSFTEYSSAQETPMSFVQRRDVSTEIGATAAQLLAARSLSGVCDAACQQRLQQTLQNLDPSFFDQFQALSPQDQQQVATTTRRENQEAVEMEILEDNVLDPVQMMRFNQLWQQNLGIGALTSPATTELLNMSPQQINQIQQFQNDATSLINACMANPNLTDGQKNVIINNINNITIDNSINILENAQIGELTINLGEPFTFDDIDPTSPDDPSAPSDREPLPQGPISNESPTLIATPNGGQGDQGSTTRGGINEVAAATQNNNVSRANTGRTNVRTRNSSRNARTQPTTRSRNSNSRSASRNTAQRPRPQANRGSTTRAPQRSHPAPSRSRQPAGNQGSGRR